MSKGLGEGPQLLTCCAWQGLNTHLHERVKGREARRRLIGWGSGASSWPPSLGPWRMGEGTGILVYACGRAVRMSASLLVTKAEVRWVDGGVVRIPHVLHAAGGIQTPVLSDTTSAQAPSSLRYPSPLGELPLSHHTIPGP